MSESGPREDAYDVVVVGAGLGGSSAAAALAKAGKKVLAVERLDGPGGVAHVFRRGPYVFDPAVHITAQGHDGGLLDVYLRVLGVRDLVEFIKQEPFYGVDFPDLRLGLPVGTEQFIAAHVEQFPHEAEGIRRLVELTVQVTKESQQLAVGLSMKELGEAAENFPTFFRYRTATLQAVIDECVSDARASALLGASWPYLGTPPSRLPYTLWAAMLVAHMEEGGVYCRGSYQAIPDAFTAVLERNGGQLMLETEVTSIDVRDGKVRGVTLADGAVVRAPIVVSNADARRTFDDLVGAEHLPERFVRRYRTMTPSPSAFVVYSATTLDVKQSDLAHETFVHRHWNHDRNYQDMLDGKGGGMWITMPTLHDPGLAPPGEHVVIFTSLMPYDIGEPWAQAKTRYTELMLDEVERLLPGYREALTYVEAATPLTIERYAGGQRGAIYGWDNIVSQNMPKRLPQVTPVEGLYLAGHWTHPGTGSLRAVYSGLVTAQIVLGYESLPEFFGVLAGEAPDGPRDA